MQEKKFLVTLKTDYFKKKLDKILTREPTPKPVTE